MDHNRREDFEKREMEPDRNFYVRGAQRERGQASP